MSDVSSQREARSKAAREAYIRCLQDEHVPFKSWEFYITRLRQFLSASSCRSSASLDEQEISQLLTSFGQRDDLRDWQFAQLVDAVRIYFVCFIKSPAANSIDWHYWSSSSRAIGHDHATTGRSSRPEELLRDKIQNGKNSLSAVRRQHEDLIVRCVTEIRARGYAYKTEQVYESWICRYIEHCQGVAPTEAGVGSVAGFLNELVVSGNVSASTQNQALNALVFLYEKVLHMPVGQLENLARSKRKKTVPVVLTRQEVRSLLSQLDGWQLQVVSLLYGTGMRLMEGLTLRVKDINHGQISY